MAAPKKPYQPRMTDPASGRKLQKGRPVPAANAAPPPPGVRDPYSGQPMQKGRPVPNAFDNSFNRQVGLGIRSGIGAIQAAFKPANAGAKAGPRLQAMMRGQDVPPSPQPRMKIGQPSRESETTYPPQPVTAGGRRVGTMQRTDVSESEFRNPRARAAAAQPQPPSRPSAPARNPTSLGQAAPMPASRLAPRPNMNTLDSVSRGMANTPGYEDFPASLAPGKKPKKNGS